MAWQGSLVLAFVVQAPVVLALVQVLVVLAVVQALVALKGMKPHEKMKLYAVVLWNWHSRGFALASVARNAL